MPRLTPPTQKEFKLSEKIITAGVVLFVVSVIGKTRLLTEIYKLTFWDVSVLACPVVVSLAYIVLYIGVTTTKKR